MKLYRQSWVVQRKTASQPAETAADLLLSTRLRRERRVPGVAHAVARVARHGRRG
jgi:hypothetical protein